MVSPGHGEGREREKHRDGRDAAPSNAKETKPRVDLTLRMRAIVSGWPGPDPFFAPQQGPRSAPTHLGASMGKSKKEKREKKEKKEKKDKKKRRRDDSDSDDDEGTRSRRVQKLETSVLGADGPEEVRRRIKRALRAGATGSHFARTLHVAACSGDIGSVELLLDLTDVDVNSTDDRESTALVAAFDLRKRSMEFLLF